MANFDQWSDLAFDVENFVFGKMSRDEFVRKWDVSKIQNTDIVSLLYNLNHLLADEDIRKLNPSYAEMQRNEAMKLIRGLRNRADIESLMKISFLQRT